MPIPPRTGVGSRWVLWPDGRSSHPRALESRTMTGIRTSASAHATTRIASWGWVEGGTASGPGCQGAVPGRRRGGLGRAGLEDGPALPSRGEEEVDHRQVGDEFAAERLGVHRRAVLLVREADPR